MSEIKQKSRVGVDAVKESARDIQNVKVRKDMQAKSVIERMVTIKWSSILTIFSSVPSPAIVIVAQAASRRYGSA